MKTALSLRDRAIFAILGVVALYAFTAILWAVSLRDVWSRAAKKYHRDQQTLLQENRLIAETAKWNEAYATEKAKMPEFPEGEDVDTHWLTAMDALATANNLSISRRQAGKEIEVGDVYELPIEVKDWEGSLESLVKFLYALQADNSAMFDVRALYMRPSNRKGILKGTFTLACAYMRGGKSAAQRDAESAVPNSKKNSAPKKEIRK